MRNEKKDVCLTLENVSKVFAKVESDEVTHALQDVSVTMKSGEFVSLVGPSGCGKSTILRLVAGLILPTLGRVTVDGAEVETPSPERGVVFQNPTLFPWLTVEKNIAFSLDVRGMKDGKAERVDQMIRMIGLERFRNDYPAQLSGGMAQRVALVRTLINEPEILLLDEPLGALDEFTRMNMQDEILNIWSQKKQLALMVTHSIDEAVYCADDAETADAVRSDGSVSDALATGLGVTVPEDETGRFASADGIHADVDYADMTWYIYDAAELLDKAARLGETADGKEAADLYDWLMAEYAKVYTLDNLAYIDFYAHPGDETLSDACRQLDSVLNEVNDALCTALSDALDGPAGSALRSYIGEDKATALVGYDEQTDRQREITERVSELTLQYNALIMEYLSYDEETEKIGALYRELVDLHNEEAQIVGYKDYADYAYEASYGRDFTPDDAAALCEAVKPYARQYFGSLYYNEATYADFSADTDLTERELVGLVTQYMPRVSDDAAKAAAYMEKHGLYFMDSAERVSDLGFTTTLDQYNAPFIYLALYGDQNDIQSMFHEFGHYYDAYVNPVPDLLLSVGSLDIFEIHSTGMEALSTGWD